MPLLKLETTVALNQDKLQPLLSSLSRIVAQAIGKPEQYVMVSVSPAAMLMSGKTGEAAFVDLCSIGGLSASVNKDLSKRICALLQESVGIPSDRVYLNFTDVGAQNWGWNGSTFG